jgi:integrase
MSKSSDSRKQYLKRRGQRWFLNYPIPANLQPLYLTEAGKPMSHIVRTVGTSDLDEAHRRKFGMIHLLQGEFSAKQRESRGIIPAEIATALAFRKDIQEASNAEDYEQLETLDLLLSDEIDRIVEKGEYSRGSRERAGTLSRIARGSLTLVEAFEDWIANTTLPVRTRQKYRTALDEFVAFVGGTPFIEDMSRDNAIRYVDWLNREARSQRTKAVVPLAYNTKRDRIGALSAFWNKGLSARKKTTERVSPWERLEVTEVPTASTIAWDTTANTRPKRRESFEEADLEAIYDAKGPRAGAKLRYPKRTLLEVFTLALLTGARPDEICSLTLGDLRAVQDGFTFNFTETKTKDDRCIPVVHPVAVAVIKHRMGKRKQPTAQLFEEFRPKKDGTNMYELVGRSLNRHLDRAVGLAADAVPYATRHTFATWVGDDMTGITDHALKRYIGHKPEGMTDRHYRGVKPAALLAVARKVRFPDSIETRMRSELGLEPAVVQSPCD